MKLDCLVCNSAMSPWLHVPGDWRRPNIEEDYQLYWCHACNFGQMFPRPNAARVQEFYQLAEYYTHGETGNYNAGKYEEDLFYKVLNRLAYRADRGQELTPQWLKENLADGSRSVCEIGCGGGSKLDLLKDCGYDIVGVEPDDAAREVAISKGFKALSGTAEMLPKELENLTFDAVFMNHVLEHVIDPKIALRNAQKILAPGGRLIVETPNCLSMGLQQSGINWHFLDAPRHLNFFSNNSLKLICQSGGLTIERLQFKGYSRQFSKNWIDIEKQIFQQMKKKSQLADLPPENNYWQAANLFLRTFWASPDRKYDSVRVVASIRPT